MKHSFWGWLSRLEMKRVFSEGSRPIWSGGEVQTLLPWDPRLSCTLGSGNFEWEEFFAGAFMLKATRGQQRSVTTSEALFNLPYCLPLLILWDSMACSTLGLPVLHHLPEFAQVHVHCISDAIQPSHPLTPSSPVLNLSQHQGLFQWVGSSHQVAKVLELQLQHQSFQWIFRVDFL